MMLASLSTIIMLFVAMSPIVLEQLQQKPLAGIWEGKLYIGKNTLRLVFNVVSKNDSLSITLDSPDQGAKGFAASGIMTRNDSLLFAVPSIGGNFAGKIYPGTDSIDGRWMQGPASLPIVMKRVEKVEALRRPQTPQKPYPYDEVEVSYRNEADSVTLAGTLTLPKEKGPFPAVILITGSGAQDRDESLLGHKPFLVLSDYLTRRGIAVLRVDDRGIGGSTGKTMKSTTADFAEDVLAGVAYLKSRKEISKKKIGLVGHSEGGVVAPLAATMSKDVAFIVMMAGTGMTGEEIIQLQTEKISRVNGETEESIQFALKLNAAAISVAKLKLDSAEERRQLRTAIEEYAATVPDSIKAMMKNPIEEFEAESRMFFSPWAKFFLTHDPRPVLKKVRCPVLAINGEKDLQVPAKENLTEIENALKNGGNKKYTIKTMAGLNHLFQHSETGSPMEYGKIEETMAPGALKEIGDWITSQTK